MIGSRANCCASLEQQPSVEAVIWPLQGGQSRDVASLHLYPVEGEATDIHASLPY